MRHDKALSYLYFISLSKFSFISKGGILREPFRDTMRSFAWTASLHMVFAILFTHVDENFANSNATNTTNGENII